LNRIACINQREVDLRSLAYTIAPALCCPRHYAYMSLRHQEDLNKIRPAVSFMIKHAHRIFTEQSLPRMQICAAERAESSAECKLADPCSSPGRPAFVRPNLTVLIPHTAATTERAAMAVVEWRSLSAAGKEVTPRSMGMAHSLQEWRVSLVYL
jgi:hypothetical protein